MISFFLIGINLMNKPCSFLPLTVKIDQIIIRANGDIVDIYYPDENPREINYPNYPLALFLQGFEVDKSYYTQFATQVASYGFVVIVPNHNPAGNTYLAPELQQIIETFEEMKINASDFNFPFSQWIDTQKLILLGHSCGGITGIEAIRNETHLDPVTGYHYRRPPELAAGIFYGTNALSGQDGSKLIKNAGIPMALIAGNLDTIIPPEVTQQAYENIETSPKAYMMVKGANHYGITDVPQPLAGPVEIHPSTVNQSLAIQTIANWSGLFLRAYIFQDSRSKNELSSQAENDTETVKVVLENLLEHS